MDTQAQCGIKVSLGFRGLGVLRFRVGSKILGTLLVSAEELPGLTGKGLTGKGLTGKKTLTPALS